MKLKLAVCVALAVVLQSPCARCGPSGLRRPAVIVVGTYFALQRDAVLAVMIGTVAGLSTDVLSSGLLARAGSRRP